MTSQERSESSQRGRRAEADVRWLPLGAPPVQALWRSLQLQGVVRSPFETWEWVSALRDVPECSTGVRVALVGVEGRSAGLFSLEWASDAGGLRLVGPAGWRWLGLDHVDVLAAPEDRDVVARAVIRDLVRRRDWDVLDLDGLRPDGALAHAVSALRRPLQFHRRVEPIPVPFVDLRSFDVDVPFRSSNLRQQVRRGLRLAERSGGLSVIVDPDEVAALIPELARLHGARFGGSSAVFATTPRCRFHQLAAGRLAAAGMARIYRVHAQGRTAALLYALQTGSTHFYYTMGMDPSVGHSPGRTVLGQAILTAAREGGDEFDLLRGEHEYKMRFASGARENVRLRLLRPTPRVLARAGVHLRARLVTRVRQG